MDEIEIQFVTIEHNLPSPVWLFAIAAVVFVVVEIIVHARGRNRP